MMRNVAVPPCLLLLLVGALLCISVEASDYAMYVWTRSFNESAPFCGGIYPDDKDVDGGSCFYHAWETEEARSLLWGSCAAVPGREVTRIFLADVKNRIENGGLNADGVCDETLLTLLREADARNIEVYALFSASNAAFSEQTHALYPDQFNSVCGNAAAQFSGVAVNNEYFSAVKACTPENEPKQVGVLQDLQQTAINAGDLPLHFSLGWNWDCCECSSSSYQKRLLDFNGTTKSALEHMIDIVDSVDVQVSWNKGLTMKNRSLRPYNYWESTKANSTNTTNFYVLAYTNPTSDCRFSFSPHAEGSSTVNDTCPTDGVRTEAGMYAAFDEVIASEPHARGGIHYLGGVYNTGMAGWPARIEPEPEDGLAMYVWTRAFNKSAPFCGGVYPADKNVDGGSCFYHAWETEEARARLWKSCSVPGREVTRIFLSDSKNRIENGGLNGDGVCDEALLTLLKEADARNIEVYALFSAGDAAFSEQGHALYPNQFNSACGTSTAQYSGVAVNNLYFTSIKSCTAANEPKQLGVLQDLQQTAINAGDLPLHFSVSWNWDCCSCSSSSYQKRLLDFNGMTKSALEHMIDIVDSVDVQVSWNKGSTMTRRSLKPYDYWELTKANSTATTNFYVLAYTNPTSDCRFSFSPHKKGSLTSTDSCPTGVRTEEGMYSAIDEILESEPHAHGGIYFLGGVYSSGMPGWPLH